MSELRKAIEAAEEWRNDPNRLGLPIEEVCGLIAAAEAAEQALQAERLRRVDPERHEQVRTELAETSRALQAEKELRSHAVRTGIALAKELEALRKVEQAAREMYRTWMERAALDWTDLLQALAAARATRGQTDPPGVGDTIDGASVEVVENVVSISVTGQRLVPAARSEATPIDGTHSGRAGLQPRSASRLDVGDPTAGDCEPRGDSRERPALSEPQPTPQPDAGADRCARFNDTTGALTWNYQSASLHPDRCKCQGNETTPHKHYAYPPYACARCSDCKAYEPAVAASHRAAEGAVGDPLVVTRSGAGVHVLADCLIEIGQLREMLRKAEADAVYHSGQRQKLHEELKAAEAHLLAWAGVAREKQARIQAAEAERDELRAKLFTTETHLLAYWIGRPSFETAELARTIFENRERGVSNDQKDR